MVVKIRRVLSFIILSLFYSYSESAPKIIIGHYENWSHPVLAVFKKYDISIYKVRYSKDGTCPTFYTKSLLKLTPGNSINNLDNKMYFDLLKANYYFPYALVSIKDKSKVNVGWKNRAKKEMAVNIGKISFSSTCLGNSHANVDDEADYDKFKVSEEMKKRIMGSSFKEILRRKDGRKFVAYLYAQDEQTQAEVHSSCDSGKQKYLVKSGHYYIYLYDESSGSFFPGRLPVFRDDYIVRMNVQGAHFFVLSSTDANTSDVLFVSQFGDCTGDTYEAYGFNKDQLFLKKYAFLEKNKTEQFYGFISQRKKIGELLALGSDNSNDLQKLYISCSKEFDMLRIKPASENVSSSDAADFKNLISNYGSRHEKNEGSDN